MRDRGFGVPRPMTTEEKRLAKWVREGRASQVESMLDAHPDLIRVGYDDGRTWLHLAAERGHTALVTVLLAREPDLLRRPDDTGTTASLLAVSLGHRATLDVLIDHGIDPKDPYTVRRPAHWVSGHTLMHAAAANAMPGMVQHLLSLEVPADAPDGRGMTPLWLVSGPTFADHTFSGETPNPGLVVRTLLAAGANAFRSGEHVPATRLVALPRLDPRREAFEQKVQENALRDVMEATGPSDPSSRPRARL